MKFIDINKRFTEITAEYITKGYTFNAGSMSGHQGEVAKVDLTDGKEIIRIVIDAFTEDGDYYITGLRIAVLRCVDNVTPNNSYNSHTIWTSHCEVISEEKFYVVGRTYGRRIPAYGTLEEAIASQQKAYDRYRARRTADAAAELTPTAALIRMLKHRKGFTNATRTNITVTRVHDGYEIKMAGRNGGSGKKEIIRFPGKR